MNDIAQSTPLAPAGADIFDLYPATIPTKIGTLRLVSATGAHGPESPFTVLETVWGIPCDGLVYMDETERRGRHLVAVFHGETEERTAIAFCHQWRWQWFSVETDTGEDAREAIIGVVCACLNGASGDATPPAGTLVGASARKGAEVAA